MNQSWCVYVIRCLDGSLYTGITTNISRRFQQHAAGKGAKYFRGRVPELVVYLETQHTRSSASKRELQIKAMQRSEKLALMVSYTDHGVTDELQTEVL